MPPQVDTALGDLFTSATSGFLGACPSLRIRDPWLSNWRKHATGCHRLLSKLTKAYYAASLRTILEEPPGPGDPALAATPKKCYEATNGNVVPVQSRAKKKIQLRNRQRQTLAAVGDQPTENEPARGPCLIARLEMVVESG
jgi:hypothetical protein